MYVPVYVVFPVRGKEDTNRAYVHVIPLQYISTHAQM